MHKFYIRLVVGPTQSIFLSEFKSQSYARCMLIHLMKLERADKEFGEDFNKASRRSLKTLSTRKFLCEAK